MDNKEMEIHGLNHSENNKYPRMFPGMTTEDFERTKRWMSAFTEMYTAMLVLAYTSNNGSNNDAKESDSEKQN